ncbi:MAG: YgjV family protein [Conchiformibius sp.]|nr:YgjV family protein [Conchiformibius sp.]
MNKIELLGYAASIIVAVSFMVADMRRLRLLNLLGSLCFAVYSLLIKSYPIFFLNLFIISVNTYYLIIYYLKRRNHDTKRKIH